MVGIKNSSENKVSACCNGSEYVFAPKEIKVLDGAIAQHLVNVTFTCALGASPLKLVAEKDVPAELLSSPAIVAPEILVLRNETDKDIDVAEDGKFYTVPAGGVYALPASVAKSIHARFVLARRTGLNLEKAAPLPEAVSAGQEEHAPAHDSPQDNHPILTPSEEKPKRTYKRKNK